ncbi:MAG TPA: type II toxin-antitoxin system HicB family antitoxin [bacterium]|nr:type II toxin-antitoxin system HicB family antitoxin [bacterium]
MKKKKRVAYTAIFEWGEDGSYDVSFPALAGCYSSGDSFMEAYECSKEAIGLYLTTISKRGKAFPDEKALDVKNLELSENERLVIVVVEDINKYRPQKAVNKTVTLPYWLNEIAEKEHVNFSGVLQEALKEKLEV